MKTPKNHQSSPVPTTAAAIPSDAATPSSVSPVAAGQGSTVSTWALPTGFVCSIPSSDPQYGNTVIRAVAGVGSGLKDAVGTVITVSGWIGYMRDAIDPETGEIRQVRVINLVAANGDTYGSNSPTAVASWGVILSQVGPGPWPKPIDVRVCTRKAGDGHIIWLERA